MSEIATVTGDGGRRDRRPPVEVPAEVINKMRKAATKEEEDVLPPPPFTKSKIGGAKNFIGGRLDLNMSMAPDKEIDWRDVGGINVETAQVRSRSCSESAAIHPLAAPNGWRRFWGSAYWLYENDPDVYVGPFCKSCFTAGESSSCESKVQWENKDELHGRRICARTVADGKHREGTDLFVISYRAIPNEEISVDRIRFYKIRRMVLERIASVGTDNEIPTSTLDFSPRIRLSPPKISKTEASVPKKSSRLSTPPTAQPTYSQVRNAYHELKVATRRDPMKMPSIAHAGPAWVSDMRRHSGLPSSLYSRLPVGSFLPQPPPTLPKSEQAITPLCPPRTNGESMCHVNEQCASRTLTNITLPKLRPTCDEEAPVFGHLWLSEGVHRDDNAGV
ncbi:hypothetical protein F4803DRAFT_523619 [Xylaria telfairii]|nr:hypothetical protein F4803DRAFT_523619 [Xylaria telfairii]